MWCIYAIKCYSAIRKNEIMPPEATCVDLEIIILSEVSRTGKHKHHMIMLICRILKKDDTNELIYKRETDLQT